VSIRRFDITFVSPEAILSSSEPGTLGRDGTVIYSAHVQVSVSDEKQKHGDFRMKSTNIEMKTQKHFHTKF